MGALSQKIQNICCLAILTFTIHVVICQEWNSAIPDSSLLYDQYDVACMASITQALLQVDPCKHNLGSDAHFEELYNATNLGLKNCGRDERIRVSSFWGFGVITDLRGRFGMDELWKPAQQVCILLTCSMHWNACDHQTHH